MAFKVFVFNHRILNQTSQFARNLRLEPSACPRTLLANDVNLSLCAHFKVVNFDFALTFIFKKVLLSLLL